jgi:aquaporin Z
MVSACISVFVLQHPASPMSRRIRSSHVRRTLVGVLMGITATVLIYSPLGQRSGAHMNPGTTLTFLFLGKIRGWDALFYVLAQFAGGLAGVAVSALILGRAIGHESVNYVATQPGRHGLRVAWISEFIIAFGMMGMVLVSTNHAVTAPYTGMFAGMMVAAYIAVEAPLSGMSMNPARTLGSALPARAFRGLWIYFTAPPLAMLLAAVLYVSIAGQDQVFCAKLNHNGDARCIFNCRVDEMPGWKRRSPSGIKEQQAGHR